MSLSQRCAQVLSADIEEPVVGFILKAYEPTQIGGRSCSVGPDLPDEIHRLAVVLTARAATELRAAGRIGGGDAGEDGQRRRSACVFGIARLVCDERGDIEELACVIEAGAGVRL